MTDQVTILIPIPEDTVRQLLSLLLCFVAVMLFLMGGFVVGVVCIFVAGDEPEASALNCEKETGIYDN